MSAAALRPQFHVDPARPQQASLSGDWCLQYADDIPVRLRELPADTRLIDASGIGRIDSAGVMQLLRYARRHGLPLHSLSFRADHQALVDAIGDVAGGHPQSQRDYGFKAALARLGRHVHEAGRDAVQLVGFAGENIVKAARMLHEPRRIRFVSVVQHMEQIGLDAVPLIVVLSYLIGAVMASLGATILRNFGAEVFVVDMGSSTVLREFAGLMTAVVIAGRSASSFTAQIGAMKSNEEIDALRTLGLDPVDVLVLPRIAATVVMLPLLTFLAMMAGLAGGITVCALALDIPPAMYLSRMQEYTNLTGHFWVGISKTPLFALVIALVGCLEGLKVAGTAQSVGEHTTSSVVQAISLVIVLDALAALWFMHMGW